MGFRFSLLATVFALLLMSGCSNKADIEAAEKAKQEKIAAEKAAKEAEAAKLAAEKAEAERVAKEEAARLAVEKAQQEKMNKFSSLSTAVDVVKAGVMPTGSVEISDDVKSALDAVAETLIQYPESSVAINGYTDSLGSEERNLQLSQDRANAVQEYLLSKGVSADQVQAVGYGETNFLDETNPASLSNRRVELEISAE